MAKPALGKGLDHLMKGDAVGGKPAAGSKPQGTLGKGIERLVKNDAPARVRKEVILPAWFFFAADILLLGFTVGILLHAPRPLRWEDWLFCTITTCVAGLFGIAGVLLSAHQGR